MAIDINIELTELPPANYALSLPGEDNVRGYIKTHGAGLFTDAPVQAKIKGGYTGAIRAQILAPSVAAPTTPLAVHVGQGNVFFGWQHANPEKVDYFELYISLTLGGNYVKLPRGEFRALHGTVENIPVGRSYFFKVRAIGKNGAISGFTQVKLGKFYQPLVAMQVRAIAGSTLASGAIFTSVDEETGRIIAVQVPTETIIN